MNQEPKSKNVDIPRITFLFLSQASLAAETHNRRKLLRTRSEHREYLYGSAPDYYGGKGLINIILLNPILI